MSVTSKLKDLLASPEQVEELINLIGNHPEDLESLMAREDMKAQFGPVSELHKDLTDPVNLGSLDEFVRERLEPCLRIRGDGTLVAANVSARAALGVTSDEHIDDIDIWPVTGTSLSEQITELLDPARRTNRFYASRAQTKQMGAPVPYVVIALRGSETGQESEALLLVGNESQFAGQHARLYEEHDLSPSEIEVMEEFLRGRTLSEIANARSRSLATVRKQFYTICEKFGVTSQAELLRLIYQDAWLVSDMRPMIDRSERPHRIEAKILRPGGRTVEVIVAGDPAGEPIILLPSPSLISWPAATERLFFENGFQCITVVAPGFGKTTPPQGDVRRAEAGRDDLLAVMDQLELSHATILTSNFGLRSAIDYVSTTPSRFRQIIVQSPSLPRVPMTTDKNKSTVKILNSLQKVFNNALGLSDLAVLAAGRSFQAMSPEAAIRLIHRSRPDAVKSFLSHENYPEVHAAVRALFAQGITAGASGFKASQGDWSELIANCQVPITILGGVASDLHVIEDIKAYSARYPDKMTYLDVSDRGFATPYDMPKFFMSLVRENAAK